MWGFINYRYTNSFEHLLLMIRIGKDFDRKNFHVLVIEMIGIMICNEKMKHYQIFDLIKSCQYNGVNYNQYALGYGGKKEE